MEEKEYVFEDFIGPREAADILGIKVSTLRKWRRDDRGPTPYKFNSRLTLYRHPEVLGFRQAQLNGAR